MEGCEYVLERVVFRRSEELCFRGMLEVCALPACLCPPLMLCAVEVTDIRPCEGGCAEELEIRVCVTVQDSRGFRGEGSGVFCVQSGLRRPCGCAGLQVRRSAEICIREASFCTPCSFCVCLGIVLQTVYSRFEVVGSRPVCGPSKPECPTLPLYPPPCLPGGCACREHFRPPRGQFVNKRVEDFSKMM